MTWYKFPVSLKQQEAIKGTSRAEKHRAEPGERDRTVPIDRHYQVPFHQPRLFQVQGLGF